MALINCPECGREISDKAVSCPNCGYGFAEMIEPQQKARSGLSEKTTNPAMGTLLIVCGVIAIIFGIFTIAIIIGIFAIIGGFGLIGAGSMQISGTQKGECPYCRHQVTVPVKSKAFKCPHCKKTSTHIEDYLEALD